MLLLLTKHEVPQRVHGTRLSLCLGVLITNENLGAFSKLVIQVWLLSKQVKSCLVGGAALQGSPWFLLPMTR